MAIFTRYFDDTTLDVWKPNTKASMNADDFLAQGVLPKRQSKLTPFRADLLKLRQANLTLDRMVEFLQINDVTVTKSTVSKFLAACDKVSGTDSRVAAPNKNAERATAQVNTAGSAVPVPVRKRLTAKERHALAAEESAKYFPNRFAKAEETP